MRRTPWSSGSKIGFLDLDLWERELDIRPIIVIMGMMDLYPIRILGNGGSVNE